MYEVPLLSDGECRAVASAAEMCMASPDFVPTRVRFDATTEVPLEDLPSEVCRQTGPGSDRGASHILALPFVYLYTLDRGNVWSIVVTDRKCTA